MLRLNMNYTCFKKEADYLYKKEWVTAEDLWSRYKIGSEVLNSIEIRTV